MMIITSRLSTWLKCYILVSVALIAAGALCIPLAFIDYRLLLPATALLCIGMLGIRWRTKTTPSIKIDKETIIFGRKEIYYWKDIDSITLNTKKMEPHSKVLRDVCDAMSLFSDDPGPYEPTPANAVMLCFKNSNARFIFDHMYANTREMRSFIQQVVKDGQEYVAIKDVKITPSTIAGEAFIHFKGKKTGWILLCCLLWLLVIALGFVTVALTIDATAIYFSIIPLILAVCCLKIIYLNHYFGVSKDYFTVISQPPSQTLRIFALTDIREIRFDDEGSSFTYLIVVTNNFKTYSYAAPGLSYEKWFLLIDELERNGVRIINTSINEYYRP